MVRRCQGRDCRFETAGSVAGEGRGSADRLDELGEGMLGKVAGDVGLADDADEAVLLDHGQAADLVFFHDGEHVFNARVGIHVVGAALGQLASGHGGRIGPAAKHLMTMSRSVIIPCRRSSSPQIGRAPTPRLAHVLGRGGEGFVLADTGGPRVHDVTGGGHDVLPKVATAGRFDSRALPNVGPTIEPALGSLGLHP